MVVLQSNLHPSTCSSSLLLLTQSSSKYTPHRKSNNIFYSSRNYRCNPLHQVKPITQNSIHKEEDSPNGFEIVRHKKLLSELSTWGIGGPCNYFVQVTSHTQLLSVFRYCHKHSIRFLVIGRGSNCLFDDNGFDGCVILNKIEFMERVDEGVYKVGSGYPFNRLGVQCSNEGFTGLEFAGGVPGTIGGAAYMNAGAKWAGSSTYATADAIDSVEIITRDGRHQAMKRRDLTFGYRTSTLQDMEDLAAIVAVTFHSSPLVLARDQQQAFLARRRLSQPLGERNAGSVFRNPPGLGVSAGELIEKAGLKGFRVGGAKVSEIHANFIINTGNSTSRDMLELNNLIKGNIYSKFGIQLEEEISHVK